MQITDRHIDDFKTDRKDITPPLPLVLRLVPLLFYCSIGLAIALSLVFFSQIRVASSKRDNSTAQAASLKLQTQEAHNQRTALEAQIKKAKDVENWIVSSRPLQPLVVNIARSVGQKSAILDLRLDRIPELPAQLKLSLKLATDSTKQLDTTMESIAKHKYRAFSPVQSLGRGELDYRATLVRQEQTKTGEEVR